MEVQVQVRKPESMFELLHHERYTAEELAKLLGIGLDVVRHATFSGELRGQVIGHHIICLQRQDILRWLRERGELTESAG
jgi:excisionase family DNA binding protein